MLNNKIILSNSRPRSILLLAAAISIIARGGYFGLAFADNRFVGNGDGHDHFHLKSGEYVGTELFGQAPAISLTDHRNNSVSISDLIGTPVILTFMDTKCTNTCPLTALEFRTLYSNLADNAKNVAFVGINVNKDFSDVSDTDSFTSRNRLDELPNWYFLSGSDEELEPVWSAYNIQVEKIPGSDEYSHTPGNYIIDATGNLRWYVSVPLVDGLSTSDWDGPRLSEILLDRTDQLEDESS